MLRLNQKLPAAHNLLAIDPDIEIPSHHVNVRRRIPLRSGVRPIRISKRNVYARIFLVLQNLADDVFQFNVSADGELAHPVAVLVRVRVGPEIVLQFLVAYQIQRTSWSRTLGKLNPGNMRASWQGRATPSAAMLRNTEPQPFMQAFGRSA